MKFNLEEDREKWKLTDEEFEANMEEIFGEISLCAQKTSEPSFIIVGGQAGSGKSVLVAKEYQELGGNAIIIDQDELRPKFPKEKYTQIHDNYTEREEYLILKPYISKAIRTLVEKAISGGYNIIYESALRSINSSIKITQQVKEKGYTTKLSVLAVPEVEANISMLMRYCYYIENWGECRRNSRIDPVAVQSVRTNIETLDSLGIFDDIIVSVRGKQMDSLPEQRYSQKKDTQLTPVQAYDEGIRSSFDHTKRNFDMRYKQIKAILVKYKEYQQLEKLEEIRKAFEREKSEMR